MGFFFVALAAQGGSLAALQEVQWVRHTGNPLPTAFDTAPAIAADADGNSYVTGSFSGTASFGPGVSRTASGPGDAYVAKYDRSGKPVWVRQVGNTGNAFGLGVTVDGSGRAYVAGGFTGAATFGTGEAAETTFTAGPFGAQDGFVARYAPDGSLDWVRRIAGSNVVQANTIALDPLGYVGVGGWFAGTANFGAASLASTGAPAVLEDAFLARYDEHGGFLWARKAGGAGFDVSTSLAIDDGGRSCLTGYFSGTATFGPGVTASTGSASPTDSAFFLACYRDDGSLDWVRHSTGPAGTNALGQAVRADDSGALYVTGRFLRNPTFDPGGPAAATLTGSTGTFRTFLARYDDSGALEWVRQTMGAGSSNSIGLAVGQAPPEAAIGPLAGSTLVLVVGQFSGTAVFGPGQPQERTLSSDTSAGLPTQDGFLATFDDRGSLVDVTTIGGTGFMSPQAIAQDGFGFSHVCGIFSGNAVFGRGEAGEKTLEASFFDAFTAVLGPGDVDGDGVPNVIDNCPRLANASQADLNGDGRGDACAPVRADLTAN